MTERAPRVTILVPSIGRMDYLPETRRCVEAQTFRDFRVVVLDNASPPEAVAFFEAWRASDPRVAIARVEPRVPMFENFNRGLRACTTELVTFFHDDDVYHPNYLEVLVGALDRNPTAAFAGSNFDFVDEHGRVLEERRWIRASELWSGPRYVEELVGRGRNPVPMPGLVFRTARFPNGFDDTLPIHFGDFVLLMRAAEEGGMFASAEPVVSIRKHSGQASAMKLSKSVAMRTELMLAYLDEYRARHPEDGRLVRHLRRRVELTHRAALVWGWVSSPDAGERDACLAALGEHPGDAAVRGTLRFLDRRGLRPGRVGPRLVELARSAAETLRI